MSALAETAQTNALLQLLDTAGCRHQFDEAVSQVLRDRSDNPTAVLARALLQSTEARAASDTSLERKSITIVHFNDVYNAQPRKVEPVGGAARFVAAINSLHHLNPLILCSVSTVTKGKHMVSIVNACGVRACCLGNHDLDFGVETFMRRAGQCHFPWLCANVKERGPDGAPTRPLGGCDETAIIRWGALVVGIVGIVEEEWLDTLNTIERSDVVFEPPVEAARRFARQLLATGVDLVVALTHMRQPNDELLLREVAEVDLVLGGHDHGYAVVRADDGRTLVKSGSDFVDLSVISLTLSRVLASPTEETRDGAATDRVWKDRRVHVEVQRIRMTSDLPEDPIMKAEVQAHASGLEAQLNKILGETVTMLDGRFEVVRSRESSLGNLICDIMKEEMRADAALINGGSLRLERAIEPGPITMGDLGATLPIMSAVVLIRISGRALLFALENGVSAYPKLEGRFPQVSGVRFEFDASKPPGSRIDPSRVTIGDSELHLERCYTIATVDYLLSGKDGYECLAEAEVIVAKETGPRLPVLVRNYLTTGAVVNGFRQTASAFVKRAAERLKRSPSMVDGVFRVRTSVEGRIVCVGE